MLQIFHAQIPNNKFNQQFFSFSSKKNNCHKTISVFYITLSGADSNKQKVLFYKIISD